MKWDELGVMDERVVVDGVAEMRVDRGDCTTNSSKWNLSAMIILLVITRKKNQNGLKFEKISKKLKRCKYHS